VLDIGAWDGFFSFAAERLGGSRVVAPDKHVWALDWEAKRNYKAKRKVLGSLPQPYYLVTELWDFDKLPGKRGFDLAHDALQSRVEVVVKDFMKMDLELIARHWTRD
jgi:predicted nicotinamide N-methyase